MAPEYKRQKNRRPGLVENTRKITSQIGLTEEDIARHPPPTEDWIRGTTNIDTSIAELCDKKQ